MYANYRAAHRALAALVVFTLAALAPSMSKADSPAAETEDKSKSPSNAWKSTADSKKPDPVDSFGAFQSSIPIDVPEFRSITPALGLSYRSSGGNGSVGVGWSLDGAPRIERGSVGKGTPLYDATDIFLLDGDELVPCVAGSVSPSCTSGGTHSTKTESYAKLALTGTGSASRWTITKKDGTKSVYAPVFSLPGPDGTAGTADDLVFRWGLQQVIDTKNNIVTYTWGANQFGGLGEYLDSISYNGTTIKLYYEQRSDVESDAIGAGQRERVSGRVKTIDLKVGGSRVRSYKLAYTTSVATSRSLLTSVQQFGKDATLDASGTVTGGTSLPAIPVGYASTTAPSFIAGNVDTSMTDNASTTTRFISLDLNGDGKQDMLQIHSACTLGFCQFRAEPWYSTGTGFTVGTYVVLSDLDQYTRFLAMDVDGDGKDDFVSLARANTNWKRTIYFSTGTGFVAGADDTEMGYKAYNDVPTSHFLPMDINGDGSADMLEMYQSCGLLGCAYHRIAWLSYGAGFTRASDDGGMTYDLDSQFYAGDFNGDGKSDFVELQPGAFSVLNKRVWLSNGTSFTLGASDNDATYKDNSRVFAIDVNGDGKTDLVQLLAVIGGHRRTTWLSTGTSLVQTSSVVVSGLALVNDARVVAGDFNGDGKDDLVWMDAGAFAAQRTPFFSNGTDFSAGSSDSLASRTGHQYLAADVNGDGRPDMVELYEMVGSATGRAIWLTGGPSPDLLTSIGTGLGGTTTVSYTPSSAWTNTSNTSVVQTATAVTVADGRGNSSTTTFSFSGGNYDVVNRRPLGFSYRKATDPCIAGESACPYTETWFRQDNGALGKPTQIRERDGSGKLLRAQVYDYTVTTTIPWTALTTGRWEYTYINAGAACPGADCKRKYTAVTYSAYGEVTQEVDYGDYDVTGDEDTTTTLYVPNTSAYIVNLPADVKTFQGVGTTGTLLNEALAYYDGATTWNQAPSAGFETKRAQWLSSPSSFVVTQKTYDSWGNVTAEINPLGATTSFVLDSTYHLYPTSSTNALTQTATKTWDPVCGKPTQTVDLNGQATTLTYDALCRLITKTGPGGSFETHTWVSLGNAASQYEQVDAPAADGSASPLWKRRYFDGLNRTWRSVTKGPDTATGNIYADTTFNARGQTASTTAAYYYVSGTPTTYVTTYGYDALDRPTRVTFPDGAFATTSYALWSTTTTDELGRSMTDRFNADGNRVGHDEVVGGVTKTTSFAYDARQNLQQTTDPAGNITTTATTDSLGRVTQQVDLDWGTTTFEYDGAGRLTAKTDVKSQRTTFGYDALDRKTSTTSLAGTAQAATVSWAYDQSRTGYYDVGALTTMTDGAGTKTLDYDVLGRVVKAVRTINGTSYTLQQGFDAGGRALWTTYPDADTLGTTASPLLYDSAGRLKSIPGYVTAATYDADGDVTQITNVNGTVTTRSYSAQRGWLTGISTTKGATTLQNLAFTRNAKGMITNVTSPVTDEGWTYTFDELDRLTTATSTSSSTNNQTLAYDALGNITTNSRLGSYAYHATKKHAVATAGANTYTYDATGLMTSGAGRTLTWNGDNRLATVTNGGTTFTMTYDADGARIAQAYGPTTHHYLGDDYEVENGWVTKHVSLGGMLVATKSGTTKLWIHADHLGSIQAETDAAGVEVYRKKYRPYGEILSAAGKQDFELRGYTAQRHDDSGLIYLHARYYDPVLGRFISGDDVIDGTKTAGLNRYAYTQNDPINRSDISGQCSDPKNFCVKEPQPLPGLSVVGPRGQMTPMGPTAPGAPLTRQDAIDMAKGLLNIGSWFIPVGRIPAGIRAVGWVGHALWDARKVSAALEVGSETGLAARGTLQSANAARATEAAANSPKVVEGATAPVGRLGSPMIVERGTNVPGSVGGRQYTGHAFDQMQGRGIFPSVVEDTIQFGTRSAGRDGATIFQTNQARVIVNPDGSVKTVMPFSR